MQGPDLATSTFVNSSIKMGGVEGAAIKLTKSTKMLVQRSTIESMQTALQADATSSFLVSTSTLIGGVDGINNSGEKKCVTSDDGAGNLLGADCQVMTP